MTMLKLTLPLAMIGFVFSFFANAEELNAKRFIVDFSGGIGSAATSVKDAETINNDKIKIAGYSAKPTFGTRIGFNFENNLQLLLSYDYRSVNSEMEWNNVNSGVFKRDHKISAQTVLINLHKVIKYRSNISMYFGGGVGVSNTKGTSSEVNSTLLAETKLTAKPTVQGVFGYLFNVHPSIQIFTDAKLTLIKGDVIKFQRTTPSIVNHVEQDPLFLSFSGGIRFVL